MIDDWENIEEEMIAAFKKLGAISNSDEYYTASLARLISEGDKAFGDLTIKEMLSIEHEHARLYASANVNPDPDLVIEATKLVDAATVDTVAQMMGKGWRRCSELLEWDEAIAETVKQIRDYGSNIAVTQTNAGFYIWVRSKP